jgi:hypothetical protein
MTKAPASSPGPVSDRPSRNARIRARVSKLQRAGEKRPSAIALTAHEFAVAGEPVMPSVVRAALKQRTTRGRRRSAPEASSAAEVEAFLAGEPPQTLRQAAACVRYLLRLLNQEG